ncbi:unannotated protein [freshwater metagenome]|uniref:Unannotated protein n=1 Tax=freshwater metagenome TaxID=449393 RepID=A0A6J6UJF4_9ZZZZ
MTADSPNSTWSAVDARSSATWWGLTATAVLPHMRSRASMPSAARKSMISLMFSRPRRRRVGISRGHRERPCATPCVRDSEKKPPLRPEAPKAISCPSSSTTSAAGSAAFASMAAHSPVSPPPTMRRSHDVAAVSGSQATGASGRSVQKGRGAASASAVALDAWVVLMRRGRLLPPDPKRGVPHLRGVQQGARDR